VNRNPAIPGALAVAVLLGAAPAPAQMQAQTQAQAQAQMQAPARSGQQVYETICQACHLPGGVGDPGSYPALAGNEHLQDGGYPAYVVVNGLKAMPSFASMLQDREIANVVNYVRTNFGNRYQTPITEQEIKTLRQNME